MALHLATHWNLYFCFMLTRYISARENAQKNKANISRYKPSTYILHILGREPITVRVITKEEEEGH